MYKVLIAEDDQMLSEIYQKKFESAGFDVEIAKSGNETLKKIREFIPDLVMLDLVMPEKDGFDVLEKIKWDAKLKNTKVIVFSNLSQQEDIEKAEALGAEGFIVKSNFTPQEIVEKAKEVLAS